MVGMGDVSNHGLPGWARIKQQGCAWASQAAMDFQIPPQASLHGILKTHRSFCFANWPCFGLAIRRKDENSGLRLAFKRGCV